MTSQPLWIARSLEPGAPITAQDQTYLEDLLVGELERQLGPVSPEDRTYLRAQLSFAEMAPVLRQIRVAPNGDVWLQHAMPVTSMEISAHHNGWGGPEWQVLSRDGLPRGRLRFPEGYSPRRFMDPWIYGVLSDTIGLQTVARVRVEW